MKVSLFGRWARGATKSLWALAHRDHPVLVHLVTVGRCNRTCGYCSEYDGATKPVESRLLVERLEQLSALGTASVLLTSREPVVHPEIESLVASARRLRMLAMLRVDGGLGTDAVDGLNRAGLDHLRIDLARFLGSAPPYLSPDVERGLEGLARRARFGVALWAEGAGAPQVEWLAARARVWGVDCVAGPRAPLASVLGPLRTRWPIPGSRPDASGWMCRAGARYLYVDEHGVVHYCSLQRGQPAIPLAELRREHMRTAYATVKTCTQSCTLRDARQVAWFDDWRAPQAAGEVS